MAIEYHSVAWYEESIKDYFCSNRCSISAKGIIKMLSLVNKHENDMILDFKNNIVNNFDNVDIPYECIIFNDRHDNIIKARTALMCVAVDTGIDLQEMAELAVIEDEEDEEEEKDGEN